MTRPTQGERNDDDRGFALITVLMLAVLITTLLGGYFATTYIEITATRASMEATRGFYAAEAGLNIRAEELRQRFLGYDRPAGASPTTDGAVLPCASGNNGSGDFRCISHSLERRSIETYVEESPSNPRPIVIPRGEPYQNLSANQYEYNIVSVATNDKGNTEASVDIQIKSRLVPLFQFGVFYNKDLEILPSPPMTLSGPVHTNGDLYLGGQTRVDLSGAVTAAGRLFRGPKNVNDCPPGDVRVADPSTLSSLPDCSSGRAEIVEAQLAPWTGMVRTGVETVTVPDSAALEPTSGEIYWDKADLRIALDMNATPPVPVVRNVDGSVDAGRSATLASCVGLDHVSGVKNFREGGYLDLLDVSVPKLLDCIHLNSLLDDFKALDDDTDGGLVLHIDVDGPQAGTYNLYGVRLRDGAKLAADSPSAPAVRGLTIVSSQALYVQGSFNTVNKLPAALICDSINVLSNNWDDANSDLALSTRIATSTTINAAILTGTDTTGGIEGVGGQDLDEYNGGFENMIRLHEDWSGVPLRLRGSFVSLYTPQHVDGPFAAQSGQYNPPIRDWDYDTDFDVSANLPPLSPHFVYLRQELFVRRFSP